MKSCFTNNALVSKLVFDRVGLFDSRFQLCGGEDVQFFKRVSDIGVVIVWADKAIVRERFARDRANALWLLHRSYQGGNSYALIEASLVRQPFTRFLRFAKGCSKIAVGLLKMPPSAFIGRASMMKSLRLTWLGAGMLTGALNRKYVAYKDVSGDIV